jgi:methylamine dehydrogenase heavy chain
MSDIPGVFVALRDRVAAVGRVAFAVWLSTSSCVAADLPVEPLTAVTLPKPANPHWVWVNDIVFHHMADGKAYLIDGDEGRFLGMLSTGYGFNGVVPSSGDVVFSPETYFSRGTRGKRTDVVTLYSNTTLSPVAEIEIPAKRSASMAMLAAAAVTDDSRFLLLYNFTPAQSVTVVDTVERKFVGEIETAGCALVYPTGARSFFSICANGTLLNVSLDEQGRAASLSHTARFFDPDVDPVTEKGVRVGKTWWFASFAGQMHSIEVAPEGLRAGRKWWLTGEQERASGWRSGGLQHLAVHRDTQRLYAVMHEGGPATHKDPGKEIWVYDLNNGRRLQRISTKEPVTSILVSQDASPLLFACFIGRNTLDVYDARTGKFLRSVGEIGLTPTTLVSP